ncbi:hypothetical protein LXL04_007650 [Taraxacum kok-saghyz]
MGCRPSKVDDLPLVIRCRERKRLIKSAADYRYDLSSSHLAYFHSLREIGFALSRFVDEQLVIPSPSPSSPVLTLPSDQGKTKTNNNGSMSSGSISHIHSIDGGNEDSDSDSDLSSSGHIHLHDSGGFENEKPRSSSFNRPHGHGYNEMDSNDPYLMNREPPPPYQPPGGPNQTNFSDPYAMNREQPPYQPPWGDPYVVNPSAYPWGPNQTSWGENEPYVVNPSASQYQPHWGPYQENFNTYNEYGGNPNPNSNQYAYYMKKSAPATHTVIQPEEARGFQETRQWLDPPHYNPYENAYGYGFSYGGAPPPQEPKKPKSPPPPPPPKDDYLNFFDAYDNGYPGYGYGYGSMVSSPDSSEVREREGIPDLEEETETESHYEEAVKGNTYNTKRNSGEGTSRSVGIENNGLHSRRIPPRKSEDTPMAAHDEASMNSVPSENNEGAQPVDIEVDKHSSETVGMGEGYEGKKGVSFDVDEDSIVEIESSILSSLTTLSVHGSRDLQEVVNEIKDEFEVAFGYGKEVALMLEAGKLPYQSRFAVLKVLLSKILYPLAPSLVSSEHPIQSVRSGSRVTKLAGSYIVDAVADVSSINLSSTLEKLYVWEKKLYKEVKVISSSTIDEERLRVMYEKMYKKLNELDTNGAESSKIDAAQASIRRLMTKLNVSIKAIDAISTEIHKVRDKELQPQLSQLIYGLIRMWQAIVKCHRKQFEALMDSRSRTLRTTLQQDSNSRAVMELETGLVTWSHHFNKWVNAQKSYIDSLNGWLNQCIDHEPELTIDGQVPYSPARLGAPPIFIICNDWDREIKSVSQDRVSKAIHGFVSNLRQLMERQDDVQRIMVKKEEKSGGGGGGGVPEKTMVASESGVVEEEWARHKEAMKLVGGGGLSSLQGGVIPIFRALETFTCDALKAHEQVRLQG